MIGTLKPLAMSPAYGVERASSGSVVKPTWLSVMMWIVPPVDVAVQRLQVERLGDDPLAGEGGVAVQQHRHGELRVVLELGPSKSVCAERAPPVTTGSTNSRWLGFG